MFGKVQNSLECKELSAIHFFSPFKNVLKDMTIPIFIQQSFASTTLSFPVAITYWINILFSPVS